MHIERKVFLDAAQFSGVDCFCHAPGKLSGLLFRPGRVFAPTQKIEMSFLTCARLSKQKPQKCTYFYASYESGSSPSTHMIGTI